jgi:hypothetical protein
MWLIFTLRCLGPVAGIFGFTMYMVFILRCLAPTRREFEEKITMFLIFRLRCLGPVAGG